MNQNNIQSNQGVYPEETVIYRTEAERQTVLAGIRAGAVPFAGRILRFSVQDILDDELRMCLPVEFTSMNPDLAVLKYPSVHRPGLIYTDPGTSVNIAFNHTRSTITGENLAEFKQAMLQTIRKMQEVVRFLTDGLRESNGQPAGFIEFISRARDGAIYNLIWFTPLRGRALLISFNCYEVDRFRWRPIVHGMLATLEVK
jgi:hypothetical protein